MSNPLKNFLSILGVTVVSSLFPFGYYGLIFGMPACLIASIIVTFLINKGVFK